MKIEVAGSDEATFCEVFGLLIEFHREGGLAPLDLDDMSRNAYLTLTEGMTLLARDDNGAIIGTLALHEVKFWYSKTHHLRDAWFYVKPQYRGGEVGKDLMQAAKSIADDKNMLLFIDVNNPDRRPKKTKATLVCQTAGYVPIGFSLQLR